MGEVKASTDYDRFFRPTLTKVSEIQSTAESDQRSQSSVYVHWVTLPEKAANLEIMLLVCNCL